MSALPEPSLGLASKAHSFMRNTLFSSILLSFLLLPGAALAQAADESRWRLAAALGYGERTNPLVLSDDIPIVLDIDIAWFGERWFFDNGDLGFTMADNDLVTINAIGRFNSDRVFFGKTDSDFVTVFGPGGVVLNAEIVVPDRDYAFELGAELLADGRWGYLQAAVNGDVSGTHDGFEIYANYGYDLRRQRWLVTPSFGLSWKSANLNDYYWGVRDDEANILFPPYEAGAGLNLHARLSTSYQLNRDWAFVFVAEYERLNSEAAGSPLVAENHVVGLFAGFQYGF